MMRSDGMEDRYGRLISLMKRNRGVWMLFGMMVLSAAVFCGCDRSDHLETQGETITVIVPTSETAPAETEDSQLGEQIQTLISRYFTALAEYDLETLNNICETSEGLDEEHLREQAEYIEGYRNIDCTIMNGLVEGTYIVYAYYEMKFKYIDTLAPALSQLYVKTDGDGLPYIYQGVIDGELSAYMAELTAGSQITELADTVNQKLEAACRRDEKLDLFIRVLRGDAQIEVPETDVTE